MTASVPRKKCLPIGRRAEMGDKRTTKKGRVKPGLRLPGVPKATRPAWELSDRDREASMWHVDRALATLESKDTVHAEDRELLRESLAAAFAFHDLSILIDSIEFDEGLEDLASELKQIRIGFALGMSALHSALGRRAEVLESAKKHALNRWATDPRTKAKEQIIAELERWQTKGEATYDGVPQFALKMHARYAGVYTNERSIERIAREWIENHNGAL